MKLLKEISERSLGISDKEILEQNYTFRKSARGIIINDKDQICLQLVGKFNYYKLPGGGVEIGEEEEVALRREIIEEVGCDVEIIRPLGITIEYRNSHNLLHISYGYVCKVKGELREPQYEQGEIDDGFKSIWEPLGEALNLLENHYPENPYQARFIITREKAFLEEYKRTIG